MTVQELYIRIGGSYDEAVARLMNDDLIGRFIVRYLEDTSFEQLVAGWDAKDGEAVFRAAHAMKGVCGNLALTDLFATSDAITECFREGNEKLREETDVAALVEKLKAQQAVAIEGIEEFAKQ